MKIELATDLSIVANLATRLSRPVPSPVRGVRGGICSFYYLYMLIAAG